jgi:hypothetical protein
VDNTSQNIAHIAIPRPALMYASYWLYIFLHDFMALTYTHDSGIL